MEFQLTDEIVSFGNTLVFPIVMALATVVYFLVIIKKSERKNIAKMLKENSSFIKEHAATSVFLCCLASYILFIVITNLFVTNLGVCYPQILFSCGIEDFEIAMLWKASKVDEFSQLTDFIRSKSTYTTYHSPHIFFLESYIKFYLLLTFFVIIRSVFKRKNNKDKTKSKEYRKFFILIPVLCIALLFTFLANIFEYNREFRYSCNSAICNINTESVMRISTDPEDEYIIKVKNEKSEYEKEPFYGAYVIRLNDSELFIVIQQEIKRIFSLS